MEFFASLTGLTSRHKPHSKGEPRPNGPVNVPFRSSSTVQYQPSGRSSTLPKNTANLALMSVIVPHFARPQLSLASPRRERTTPSLPSCWTNTSASGSVVTFQEASRAIQA
jgi:hypothetical protein